jgi:hypothetical protein
MKNYEFIANGAAILLRKLINVLYRTFLLAVIDDLDKKL